MGLPYYRFMHFGPYSISPLDYTFNDVPYLWNRSAFWTALSNAQVDWNLSLGYMASSFMVVGLFIVPGGLWAGALSPILTTNLQLQGTMDVPALLPSNR